MLSFALDLADEADHLTMPYFRGDARVEAKADGSLVTRADRETEAYLRERILGRFPDHAILGEEQGFSPGAAGAARWLLDPVDGTHSFARGIPVWGTLIAFERDGAFEVGVASAPALGTRWWAGRGLGAYRGALPARGHAGERIRASAIDALDRAQIVWGSYRLLFERWGASADALMRAAWRTRGFGDFWGYCLVAEGSAEAMLEPEISPWDIAAMLVIVEEAGGRLTDVDGRVTVEAGHCVATNGVLHDLVLRTLRGEVRPPPLDARAPGG
ncbi:MAG: histidinol-phosphatase [Chloroflexi bacterium]|nr:histidinol-phosphatase [Chloroflexota bacterium]